MIVSSSTISAAAAAGEEEFPVNDPLPPLDDEGTAVGMIDSSFNNEPTSSGDFDSDKPPSDGISDGLDDAIAEGTDVEEADDDGACVCS
mmetsp:Transcript_27365/g.38683  ORF Transcript_27365/g.38683 Transcript_27365/m.38683 type:complete len:89 (+) Transcript_27365:616-882(+)